MKKIILYLLFIPQIIFAQDLDYFKKKADKEKTAENWNKLARYYSEKGTDTTALRETAQQAYLLALKESNNKEIGEALILLSESYYNQARWSEFIEKNEEALEYLKLTSDIDLQREALINIGHVYNNIGEYDKAIISFNKSIEISKHNDKKDSRLATSLINTAFAFLYKGHLDSTIYYVSNALETAEIARDTTVLIEGNNQLGILHKRKGNYEKGLIHFEKSLQLYESIKDYKRVCAVWMNIASLYSDWQKYDKALEISRKATQLTYQYNSNDANMVGRSLNYLGLALVHNNLYSSGLDTLKLAIPYLKDNHYESYTAYINLAMAYDMVNKDDSCSLYLGKAEQILSENKNFPAGRLYLYKGTLLVKRGLYKEAIPVLEEYASLQRDPTKIYTTDIYEAYNNLSKAYELGTKDYKRAIFYKNMAYEKRDSIYKMAHNNAMSSFYAQYETSEKELEISRLNEEKQEARFKMVLILSIGIFIILTLLFAFVYNRMKRLKKEKEAVLLSIRIDQKENEYKALINETEQRLTRRYLDGRESERKSLAKELHDSVANEIVSIIMQNQSDTNHKNIGDLLQNTYNHIRQISHQLMPPEFKYISLPEMIEDYLSVLNETTSVHFSFSISEIDRIKTEDIADQTSKELYCIIQESISNILKHAEARKVIISLLLDSDQLIFSVKDDGKGFASDLKYRGIGLRTMQDRSNDIGALLEIQSSAGNGTKITVTLPIDSEQHHPEIYS